MSAQTQTTAIFVLMFVMVLHLVYTKRKLTREELEKRAVERQKNEKKDRVFNLSWSLYLAFHHPNPYDHLTTMLESP